MKDRIGLNLDAVEARFREINDASLVVGGLMEKDFEELSIHERMSLRYLVIQLVEAAASVSVHLLSRLFDERVEGYADCFRRMGARKVIAEGLSERLASAARLRNLLVHRYWEIDDRRVYTSIEGGIEDFEVFKREVRSFMEETPS